MKRILTVLLAVLFLITVFAGCGSKNEETPVLEGWGNKIVQISDGE